MTMSATVAASASPPSSQRSWAHKPRWWTVVVGPSAHAWERRNPPPLFEVRLDAVAKAGDEGTQQYGTQEYLSPAPTVDSGTTAVDDLIPNDRQIPE